MKDSPRPHWPDLSDVLAKEFDFWLSEQLRTEIGNPLSLIIWDELGSMLRAKLREEDIK